MCLILHIQSVPASGSDVKLVALKRQIDFCIKIDQDIKEEIKGEKCVKEKEKN